MPMSLVRLASLAALAVSSCTAYIPANNVKLVTLSEDAKPGKTKGVVTGEDCATQVFGFGRPPETLRVTNAIDRAIKKDSLTYLNNFHTEMSGMHILVFNRTCINVRAEGFK